MLGKLYSFQKVAAALRARALARFASARHCSAQRSVTLRTAKTVRHLRYHLVSRSTVSTGRSFPGVLLIHCS